MIAPKLVHTLYFEEYDSPEEDAIEVEKVTPIEAIGLLGVDAQWLARRTGLNINAVMRALMGGHQRIHEMTAELIAEALGRRVCELEWPSELTHLGRPPLTGGYNQRHQQLREVNSVCEEHFLIMQRGYCSYCM